MNENLKNYTRGSQVSHHSAQMFRQSVSKMLTLLLFCIVLANVLGFLMKTSARERYFLKTSIEAGLHIADFKIATTLLLGQDTAPLIMDYQEDSGRSVKVNALALIQTGISRGIYHSFIHSQLIFTAMGTGVAFFLNLIILIYFSKKGEELGDEKHLRGGTLEDAAFVAKKLKREKNRSTYFVANVPLTFRSETQHIMVSGAPGTGKTAWFKQGSRVLSYNRQVTFLKPRNNVNLIPKHQSLLL